MAAVELALIQGKPPLVTSLPTLPADGEEIFFLADATNGVVWRFRYRAASGKWEFVGGSALFSEVEADEATESETFTGLTTAGPSVVLPLAGDYDVSIGAQLYMNPFTSGKEPQMSYKIGATSASANDALVHYMGSLTGAGTGISPAPQLERTKRKTGLGAVTLLAQYRGTSGGGCHFGRRWMSVVPVRVG